MMRQDPCLLPGALLELGQLLPPSGGGLNSLRFASPTTQRALDQASSFLLDALYRAKVADVSSSGVPAPSAGSASTSLSSSSSSTTSWVAAAANALLGLGLARGSLPDLLALVDALASLPHLPASSSSTSSNDDGDRDSKKDKNKDKKKVFELMDVALCGKRLQRLSTVPVAAELTLQPGRATPAPHLPLKCAPPNPSAVLLVDFKHPPVPLASASSQPPNGAPATSSSSISLISPPALVSGSFSVLPSPPAPRLAVATDASKGCVFLQTAWGVTKVGTGACGTIPFKDYAKVACVRAPSDAAVLKATSSSGGAGQVEGNAGGLLLSGNGKVLFVAMADSNGKSSGSNGLPLFMAFDTARLRPLGQGVSIRSSSSLFGDAVSESALSYDATPLFADASGSKGAVDARGLRVVKAEGAGSSLRLDSFAVRCEGNSSNSGGGSSSAATLPPPASPPPLALLGGSLRNDWATSRLRCRRPWAPRLCARVALAVNCGGSACESADGVSYAGDAHFARSDAGSQPGGGGSGGAKSSSSSSSSAASSSPPSRKLAAADGALKSPVADEELHCSARAPQAGRTLTYCLPVPTDGGRFMLALTLVAFTPADGTALAGSPASSSSSSSSSLEAFKVYVSGRLVCQTLKPAVLHREPVTWLLPAFANQSGCVVVEIEAPPAPRGSSSSSSNALAVGVSALVVFRRPADRPALQTSPFIREEKDLKADDDDDDDDDVDDDDDDSDSDESSDDDGEEDDFESESEANLWTPELGVLPAGVLSRSVAFANAQHVALLLPPRDATTVAARFLPEVSTATTTNAPAPKESAPLQLTFSRADGRLMSVELAPNFAAAFDPGANVSSNSSKSNCTLTTACFHENSLWLAKSTMTTAAKPSPSGSLETSASGSAPSPTATGTADGSLALERVPSPDSTPAGESNAQQDGNQPTSSDVSPANSSDGPGKVGIESTSATAAATVAPLALTLDRFVNFGLGDHAIAAHSGNDELDGSENAAAENGTSSSSFSKAALKKDAPLSGPAAAAWLMENLARLAAPIALDSAADPLFEAGAALQNAFPAGGYSASNEAGMPSKLPWCVQPTRPVLAQLTSLLKVHTSVAVGAAQELMALSEQTNRRQSSNAGSAGDAAGVVGQDDQVSLSLRQKLVVASRMGVAVMDLLQAHVAVLSKNPQLAATIAGTTSSSENESAGPTSSKKQAKALKKKKEKNKKTAEDGGSRSNDGNGSSLIGSLRDQLFNLVDLKLAPLPITNASGSSVSGDGSDVSVYEAAAEVKVANEESTRALDRLQHHAQALLSSGFQVFYPDPLAQASLVLGLLADRASPAATAGTTTAHGSSKATVATTSSLDAVTSAVAADPAPDGLVSANYSASPHRDTLLKSLLERFGERTTLTPLIQGLKTRSKLSPAAVAAAAGVAGGGGGGSGVVNNEMDLGNAVSSLVKALFANLSNQLAEVQGHNLVRASELETQAASTTRPSSSTTASSTTSSSSTSAMAVAALQEKVGDILAESKASGNGGLVQGNGDGPSNNTAKMLSALLAEVLSNCLETQSMTSSGGAAAETTAGGGGEVRSNTTKSFELAADSKSVWALSPRLEPIVVELVTSLFAHGCAVADAALPFVETAPLTAARLLATSPLASLVPLAASALVLFGPSVLQGKLAESVLASAAPLQRTLAQLRRALVVPETTNNVDSQFGAALSSKGAAASSASDLASDETKEENESNLGESKEEKPEQAPPKNATSPSTSTGAASFVATAAGADVSSWLPFLEESLWYLEGRCLGALSVGAEQPTAANEAIKQGISNNSSNKSAAGGATGAGSTVGTKETAATVSGPNKTPSTGNKSAEDWCSSVLFSRVVAVEDSQPLSPFLVALAGPFLNPGSYESDASDKSSADQGQAATLSNINTPSQGEDHENEEDDASSQLGDFFFESMVAYELEGKDRLQRMKSKQGGADAANLTRLVLASLLKYFHKTHAAEHWAAECHSFYSQGQGSSSGSSGSHPGTPRRRSSAAEIPDCAAATAATNAATAWTEDAPPPAAPPLVRSSSSSRGQPPSPPESVRRLWVLALQMRSALVLRHASSGISYRQLALAFAERAQFLLRAAVHIDDHDHGSTQQLPLRTSTDSNSKSSSGEARLSTLISSPRRRSSVDRFPGASSSSSAAADKANPAVSLSSLSVSVSATNTDNSNALPPTATKTSSEELYQQKMSRVVKVASRFRAMVKFRTHSAQQARAGDAAEGEFVAFVLATSAGTATAVALGSSATSGESTAQPQASDESTTSGGDGDSVIIEEGAGSVAAVKSLLRGRGALAAQRRQALDAVRAAVVQFTDSVRSGTSERYPSS